MRNRLACVTRKTYAFVEGPATWDAALSLAIVEHTGAGPSSLMDPGREAEAPPTRPAPNVGLSRGRDG